LKVLAANWKLKAKPTVALWSAMGVATVGGVFVGDGLSLAMNMSKIPLLVRLTVPLLGSKSAVPSKKPVV
jgi:hypothetical protein